MIVLEDEPYRLITDGDERYAVIEARDGLVFSLDSHDRREAPDTSDGMAAVVGDGWREQSVALKRYQYMIEYEARYSQVLW
jgi:hypothetical protein